MTASKEGTQDENSQTEIYLTHCTYIFLPKRASVKNKIELCLICNNNKKKSVSQHLNLQFYKGMRTLHPLKLNFTTVLQTLAEMKF